MGISSLGEEFKFNNINVNDVDHISIKLEQNIKEYIIDIYK
jgi:hypothetical protein